MASGWWDNSGAISGCVLAYQPIGAASLAASYTNLQNPGTYDATPGTAPTFAAATGWTFAAGSSQYLDTQYQPVGTTKTLIARYSGVSPGGYAVLSCTDVLNTANLFLFASLAGSVYYANIGTAARSPQMAAGVIGLSGGQPYRNGATDGAAFTAGSATWRNLHVGRYNIGTGGTQYYLTGSVQAIAVYTGNLTAGEMSTVMTAMANLTASSPKGFPVISHYHHAVYGGG